MQWVINVKDIGCTKLTWKEESLADFISVMKQLRQDEVQFEEYFPMSSNQLEQLLSLIKDDFEKKEANYKESISAEERLALCLR